MPPPAPPGAGTLPPAMTSVPSRMVPERRAAPWPGRDLARGQDFMDALVPDAHLNAAVAGIRGLGGAGLRVMALGPAGRPRACGRKHTAARAVAPSVVADPRRLCRAAGAPGRGHRPAGRLPQPGGDHRRDARRPRCVGRRRAALPGGAGARAACGTSPGSCRPRRAGGDRNARVALLRARARACGGSGSRSGGREARAAGQQVEDGAPRATTPGSCETPARPRARRRAAARPGAR